MHIAEEKHRHIQSLNAHCDGNDVHLKQVCRPAEWLCSFTSSNKKQRSTFHLPHTINGTQTNYIHIVSVPAFLFLIQSDWSS